MYDFNEDDELFGGTPEKKYFDIIFNKIETENLEQKYEIKTLSDKQQP